MIMKFLKMFSTSMRMTATIDHGRIADPEYRQALIRELCGEPDGGRSDSQVFHKGRTVDPVRLAA